MAQFDLFPERVTVERLDPHSVAGPRTSVKAMFVVRYEWEMGAVHQVFSDHRGWYCGEHGRDCKAVREVTEAHGRHTA